MHDAHFGEVGRMPLDRRAADVDLGRATFAGVAAVAIVAGAGFGVYFVELKYAGASGVIWPLATARWEGSLNE